MSFVFQQLGGERKSRTLQGYAQPFGRPRQKPIMTEVIDLAIQTTVYSGSRGATTRHIFSSHWEPMELSGRWMTRHLTNGETAEKYAQEWTSFVQDAQPVRMSWGVIASWTGVIQRLELAREGEHDIAWKINFLVDSRDDAKTDWAIKIDRGEDITLHQLKDLLELHARHLSVAVEDYQPDFFDTLNNALNALKTSFKVLNDATSQFNLIEERTFGALRQFQAIIKNVEGAIVDLRLLVVNTTIDAAIVARRAQADFNYWTYQTRVDADTLDILATLKDMHRSVALQEIGASTDAKLISAQGGDSWESLAYRGGLGIDGAAAMREANGIRFGEMPEAGTLYIVPTS